MRSGILKQLRYVTPRASVERLKAIEKDAEKRAIETARYVIPLAAFTSMVHTISGITLHRLRRMAASGDAPYESRVVIGQMVDLVRQVDPFFFEKVGCEELPAEALPETGFPRPRAGGDAFASEFDARLDGKVSRLTDFSPSAEQSIAESVRVTFGLTRAEMDDDEAIDRV